VFKILSISKPFGRISKDPLKVLSEIDHELISVPFEQVISEEDLVHMVKGMDGIIVGVDLVTERVIEAADKLKVIAKHGVGVDNIDIAAATKKGIAVTNAPGSNTDAVADLAIGLMLAIARKVPYAHHTTIEGNWYRIFGTEIYKKCLGIIGLGAIGKAVARRAMGFDMEILAFDVYPDYEFAKKYRIKFVSFEELLQRSDFISLHVNLSSATRGLISEKKLKMMKKGAYLINTARGAVVNGKALYKALTEGWIAGAALDAFEEEPPKKNYELFKLENLIATPHMGAYTDEAVRNMGMAAARNVVDVLKGEKPQFLVNPEIYKKGE